LTTGEEMHPNEALLREKEFLADEAGIDLDDLDELGLDIDWGDMTPEPMAQGGRVGLTDGGDAYQQRAEELALEIFGVEDFFSLTDRIQDTLYKRAISDIDKRQDKAQGGGVGSMFRRI